MKNFGMMCESHTLVVLRHSLHTTGAADFAAFCFKNGNLDAMGYRTWHSNKYAHGQIVQLEGRHQLLKVETPFLGYAVLLGPSSCASAEQAYEL